MKVNIYVTEEVTDAERKEISQLLGVKQASRDQLKEFLWEHGVGWRKQIHPGARVMPASDSELDDLL